jgi:ABC-type xylose transport system permease subunit
MIFALMGGLAAVSAISSARLDSATTPQASSTNSMYRRRCRGGTSLAGGLGTIYGTMLGAW